LITLFEQLADIHVKAVLGNVRPKVVGLVEEQRPF